VIVIEERAAAGLRAERPSERVLDPALAVLGRVDLPDFFQADAEFPRLAVGVERIFGDQLLGQAAARAFGEQRVFAEQLHAAGVGTLVLAALANATAAGGKAGPAALVVIVRSGRGKARIVLAAERLGFACEPAAALAERADVVMMVVHQRRHDDVRQPDRAI